MSEATESELLADDGPAPRRPGGNATTLAKLDTRTKEGRLLKQVRAELVAHVGGAPDAVQAALIERVAMLRLHLARLDASMLAHPAEADHQRYAALSTALAAALVQLGVTEQGD